MAEWLGTGLQIPPPQFESARSLNMSTKGEELFRQANEKMLEKMKEGSYTLLEWGQFLTTTGVAKTTREGVEFICNPDQKLSIMHWLMERERFEDCKFLRDKKDELLQFLDQAGF